MCADSSQRDSLRAAPSIPLLELRTESFLFHAFGLSSLRQKIFTPVLTHGVLRLE